MAFRYSPTRGENKLRRVKAAKLKYSQENPKTGPRTPQVSRKVPKFAP